MECTHEEDQTAADLGLSDCSGLKVVRLQRT